MSPSECVHSAAFSSLISDEALASLCRAHFSLGLRVRCMFTTLVSSSFVRQAVSILATSLSSAALQRTCASLKSLRYRSTLHAKDAVYY